MKSYRLYIMILISAGIHLAALGFWDPVSQTIFVSTDLRSQSLNITLTKPKSLATDTLSSSHKPQLKTPASQPQSVHTQTALKSETRTTKKPDNIPTKTKPTEKQQTTLERELAIDNDRISKLDTQKFAMLNNDMIKELQSEFQARFKYPVLARKRGWQGKVVLALDVNLQGKIAGIAVKRSSGYLVLDHNAVNTFKAIGELSPKLNNQINQSHSFSIPIIYQLNGG